MKKGVYMSDLDYISNNRSKIIRRIMIPACILLCIGLLIFLYGFNTNKTFVKYSFIFFVPAILLFLIGITQLDILLKDFKRESLIVLLNEKFTNVSYNPEGGLTRSDVLVSELLVMSSKPSSYELLNTENSFSATFNNSEFHLEDIQGGFTSDVFACELEESSYRFYSNDLITAEYLDVQFKMCDIHLEEVRGSGKDKSVVTVFKGPYMEFDFNKDFIGKVQVREKSKATLFSDYERIEMESVEFNKVFKVYSTVDHTTFYILTPHIMEKLIELEKENHGRFYFSFIDGKMYIALDNRKDNFELSIVRKINKSVEIFEKQLSIIIDIIEEMKLNDKF